MGKGQLEEAYKLLRECVGKKLTGLSKEFTENDLKKFEEVRLDLEKFE